MMTYQPPRFLFRKYEIIRLVKKGDSFLEIGAGNLELSKSLLNHFKSGVVLDFSESIYQFHNKLNDYQHCRLHPVNTNFIEYQTPKKFDCILCCEVIEHIENDIEFLKKMRNTIKANGYVIVSAPARMKYWSIHDSIVGHLRRYERDDLLKRFQSAGYKDIKIISYGYPFINILRILRILLAKTQKNERNSWSQEKQTKFSGAYHANPKFNFLGIFINSITLKPFFLLSHLFKNLNLSEGYIVIAK